MPQRIRWPGALVLLLVTSGTCPAMSAREQEHPQTLVTVHAGQGGCQVDLDSQSAGKTDASGNVVVKDVEPGDHYIHVHCPGQEESGYLISVHAGENFALQATEGAASPQVKSSQPEPAQAKPQLEQLVLEALQFRAKGRLEEAADKIREALKLDPENSDLHRELGITFLLGKEWKRARIEMIEALRHDPTDADAHNGLGYALEKMGDLEAAVKEYRTATHLDPDDPTYRTHYFDALSKLSQQKAKAK